MLVPYISVKSIAKILLMLMMPGGKAPDKIPAPQLQYIQIPVHLMAQGPFVTQYNQGFLLQFQASAAAYLISPEQMDQIINSMTIAERDAAFADPANISFNLAAHIVLLNGARELSASSSYGDSSSMHFSPSPESSQGHSIHDYFESMRPPTFAQALQDKGISVSVSVTNTPRQNRFPNSARPIKGEMLTEPPGTIQQYKQQGNIQMLRLKRDCKLALYRNWWAYLATPYDIQFDLSEAEQALIDLGHIEYPQLQKMRDVAARGGMAELQARYKKVCGLLRNKGCGKGIDRNREGGSRMLRLEQHYLARAINNELIKPLVNITKAEGPEVRAMLAALYRKYYREMSQDERTYYERPAGFNIIEAAHALVMKQHPNGAQIIASVKQEFSRETGTIPASSVNAQSSSSSSSATTTTTPLPTAPTPAAAPTTTAATGPGTTTTTTSNEPEVDSVETYAYDSRVNISTEVDQRVEQALEAIKPQDFDNFELYMDRAQEVIDELQQAGQLTPTQERHLMKRFVKRVFTKLHPVTIVKEVPFELLQSVLLLGEILTIATPDDEMFAPFDEQKRVAQVRGLIEKFDMSNLSAEQWTDLAADMFVGYIRALGVSRVCKAMPKVMYTIKSSPQSAQALTQKLAEKLRSIARPAEGAVATTAEGIPVNVGPTTAAQEIMSMQSAAKKVGGAAKEFIRMTSAQARAAAEKLGFKKTNFYSDKMPVFKNKKGNLFITPDRTGHNGGVWKMADSVENLGHRTTRMGTYDALLNRIGD